MDEHTPGEWYYRPDEIVEWHKDQKSPFDDSGGSIYSQIHPETGEPYEVTVVEGGLQDEQGGAVGVLREADAKRIVRCVNSHDALLAACEMWPLLSIAATTLKFANLDLAAELWLLREEMRAAAQKAKGESNGT